MPVPIITPDVIPEKEKSMINQRCLFRVNPRQTIVHIVSLSNYSLLIDLKQMMFNLTLWLGFIEGSESDEMTIFVHFVQYEGGFDYSSSFRSKCAPFSADDYLDLRLFSLGSVKAAESFQYLSLIDEVPPSTRSFYISFVCNTRSAKNQFCMFNHVELFVLPKRETIPGGSS